MEPFVSTLSLYTARIVCCGINMSYFAKVHKLRTHNSFMNIEALVSDGFWNSAELKRDGFIYDNNVSENLVSGSVTIT